MDRLEDYVRACERNEWKLPPCGVLFAPKKSWEKYSPIVGRYIAPIKGRKIYECMLCGEDKFKTGEELIAHCKGHRDLPTAQEED